jgi:hypothetical protein
MEQPNHTLALTYYYAVRRALGMNTTNPEQAKQEFLENYRPIILSPNLVILQSLNPEIKDITDPETEEYVVLARGHPKRNGQSGHYWHIKRYPKNPNEDISNIINQDLHYMETNNNYYGYSSMTIYSKEEV